MRARIERRYCRSRTLVVLGEMLLQGPRFLQKPRHDVDKQQWHVCMRENFSPGVPHAYSFQHRPLGPAGEPKVFDTRKQYCSWLVARFLLGSIGGFSSIEL